MRPQAKEGEDTGRVLSFAHNTQGFCRSNSTAKIDSFEEALAEYSRLGYDCQKQPVQNAPRQQAAQNAGGPPPTEKTWHEAQSPPPPASPAPHAAMQYGPGKGAVQQNEKYVCVPKDRASPLKQKIELTLMEYSYPHQPKPENALVCELLAEEDRQLWQYPGLCSQYTKFLPEQSHS